MAFAKVHEVLQFIDAIKKRYPYEIEDTFSMVFVIGLQKF
jgi:hypothetical protein